VDWLYFQPGVATNTLTNAFFRSARIVNDQLYLSPQPGAGPPGGIYAVGTGLPTNGPQHLMQLFPLGGSPYQFELNPAMTIAYVADDGTSDQAQAVIKSTRTTAPPGCPIIR
jgi:hypothetical protein